MESSATVTTEGQDGENITDIQNYLQSFNKEIGDGANADGQSGNTTYFTIDASQVRNQYQFHVCRFLKVIFNTGHQ